MRIRATIVTTTAALLASFYAAAAACAAGMPAAEVRQNLYASCFVDAKEGWVVGDLGRVFHTTDGGLNWAIQATGTKQPFSSVACPSRDNVLIAGQGGQISQSKDGGATWAPLKSGSERQLLDIAFLSGQVGIAVGDYGTILRTEDGGITWESVAIPDDLQLPPDVAEVTRPGDIVLYAITHAGAEHVWLSGEFGVIMASEDGGRTWQGQTSGTESTLFGIHFADEQNGWAVGLDEVLLHTTDGGVTWQRQHIQTPKGYALAFYDVDVRGDFGWVIGSSGLLLSTKDGGKTWQLPTVPVQMRSLWFRGITMFPEGRGLIVGSGGMMLSVDRDKFTTSKTQY